MENNTKYQAEDDRMMDEMFRENLSNHRIEPSSGVWKGISRKLLWKEISRFNFMNLSGVSWIGGAAVVVLVTVTAYFFIKPGNVQRPLSASKEIGMPSATNSPDLSSQVSSLPVSPTVVAPSPSAFLTTVSKVQPVHPGNPAIIPPLVSPDDISARSESQLEKPPVPENLESISSEVLSFAFMSSQPAPDITNGMLTDTLRLQLPGNGSILILKDKIPTPNFFSASFSVLPELSFYKAPNSYSEMNYWMNLGATYHISRFSVGAGISLGYIYDEGKYRIDYQSKDSVGYYENVTGFTVNPQNPDEFIYITKPMNVYDSIQHVADDQTRNRYTYLQVPLLLGYRFIETQHIGITVQTGPAVSFLIGKKEAKPYVDYPNARIIRIENNTPNRVSTSWQLWVTLRIDYRINKTISLFAEPTYKYTFKSFEIPGEESFSNTNSIGLGIGLQVNFGKITR